MRNFFAIATARMREHCVRWFYIVRHKILVFSENRKIYPRMYISGLGIVRKDLDYLCDDDSFKEEFCRLIKDVVSQKSANDRVVFDLHKIMFPIFVMYVMIKLGIVSNVNIFGGVFNNSKGVDEFVVFLMSSYSAYTIPTIVSSARLNCIINYYIEKCTSNEMSGFMKMIHVPFQSLVPYFPKSLPFLIQSGFNRRINFINTIIYYVPVSLISMFLYFVRYYIVYNMYMAGSVGYLTIIVALLFLYTELLSALCIVTLYVPLPYKDYTWLNETDLLSVVDEDLLRERREQMYARIWESERLLKNKGFVK